MLRFASLALIVLGALLLGLAATGAVGLAPVSVSAQSDLPLAFTILGPDSAVARIITQDADCPEIRIDGAVSQMQLRAAPDEAFPVTVCDAALPVGTQEAAVYEQLLKLPKAKPERVVVIGDTGCRLKGTTVQSCNDPTAWPFAPLSTTAAGTNPDLVIHVGDYHYRESPCVVDKAECAGSPWGDNWAAWNADLFTPGRPLLQAAPWVITPGNHEDCERAGIGFFRLLDPRPMPAECPPYTEPYALNYMEPQLIVIDNSAVNDYEIEPDQVAIFEKQFEEINQIAQGTTWLVLHDPMYVFGHLGVTDGQEQLFIDQLTLQQASKNTFPPSVEAFISGHIHLFQVLSFPEGRPPQLVVGNSGTLLDPPITTPLTGLEMAGMKVAYGTMLDKFGFVLMERAGEKWAVAVKDVNGGDMEKCVLGDGSLLCGQAVVPTLGLEYGSKEWWIAVGLLGGAILFIGLALGTRSTRAQVRR